MVQLRHVDIDFYGRITRDDVAKQLKIVIGLINVYEVKHCAGYEVVKACFKKMLKNSGVV